MSIDRCSRCSDLVDTDDAPEAYVEFAGHGGQPEYVCLCASCRERYEEEQESRQDEPRQMPTNIDALIAADIAADPRNGCDQCDWDVDGCSPCPAHADL